ncbi:hypothetical protein GGX14DRAFT_575793 [Mycena pura]|uniref:Uncharacterized protein n=1 Tax=Mycena pura TaxID=153505 RepID=A0AAD6UUS7_9AGAR|nr:hypothetical protein GGX14DRAFT_575793 [Mycena pura]
MSLPNMCPMFFVDTGNWQGQRKHDAGFAQHYAFSADAWRVYSLGASSAAQQDGWRWKFERLPTWQEVLERAQAHCGRHHSHGDEDVGSLPRPTHAIVYQDERLAAAAATALGLDVRPESDNNDMYASDDEPDIRPAIGRRASPHPRGTSLASDPPSPVGDRPGPKRPVVISSETEEKAASPPRSASISTASSLTQATAASLSASAARGSGRAPPSASTPALPPTLWVNEYTGAVYAEGALAVDSLVGAHWGGVRSVTREQAVQHLKGLAGSVYINESKKTLYLNASEAINALGPRGGCIYATTRQNGIQRLSSRRE